MVRMYLSTSVPPFFSSTINRQLRDTVSWLTSEYMTIHYLQSFKKALWPTKETPAGADQVSPEELRRNVRERLVRNIPEMVVNLVGQQSARNGVLKVYESLQEKTLNRQLVYELLELACHNLFPELLQSYTAQQLKN